MFGLGRVENGRTIHYTTVSIASSLFFLSIAAALPVGAAAPEPCYACWPLLDFRLPLCLCIHACPVIPEQYNHAIHIIHFAASAESTDYIIYQTVTLFSAGEASQTAETLLRTVNSV